MSLMKHLFVLAGFLAATSAFAQDQAQRSEAEERGRDEGTSIGVTNLAIRPTAGAVFYESTEKFTGGILMDFNVLSTPWAKVGPATGILYSSTSGADFFSGVSTNNSAYFFQIPANLKATMSPDPARRLQLGVHGGANIVRSNDIGEFGNAPITTTAGASSWDVHPNVGADIDYALGTNADLTLRPDVTFLSDFNMVTATLGLGLKI